MKKLKVIILGATGRIGPSLIEEYKKDYSEYYEFIIGIHDKEINYGLENRYANILDFESLKKAFKGIDVVVNLAGNANEKEENFKKLVEPNIIGAQNVFQAAKESGCKRVIFASSVHAIKGYPLNYEVKQSDIPLPANLYGATKVFAEALCKVYSLNYGLSCFAIRVGAYTPNELIKKICFERKSYEYVITQKDFAQLIHKSIIADEKIKYAILPGISKNKKRNMDLEHAKKLIDYQPEDDVFEICEKIKK